MVITQHRGGSGYSFGLGSSSEPRDDELHELIAIEVSRLLMEDMPELFGTIKEGLVEKTDGHIQTLWAEITSGQFGAHTLIFRDFYACGAPKFFRKKDPISNICWITDSECAFRQGFSLKGWILDLIIVWWDMELMTGGEGESCSRRRGHWGDDLVGFCHQVQGIVYSFYFGSTTG